jgi:6-phosphogluconolactonase (cycloisomerase 2 family)
VSGTWSVAGSPYVVQGDIEIPDAATLVIGPGVTVRFESDAGLSAHGTLTAVGTTASLIRFTSAQVSPSPGDWDGLRVFSSSSSLAWIEIDYAVDGLLIAESNPIVSDCTVRSNANTGIRVLAVAYGCSGSRAAPTIARCQVELNLGDGVEYHGYGSGSTGCSSPKTGSVGGTLSESGVHHNTGEGIVIRANYGFLALGHANPQVLGCDIHDNGGGGILLTGSDDTAPTIHGSDVYLNAQSGIVRDSPLGTATITNNELRENTGRGLWNSSYRTIVSGNWIYDNNSEGVVTSQLRQFSENTLYGNADDYDFYYLDTVDQMALLNDWGTTDPVVIDSHIWDGLDDPSLGRVVVSPATDLVVTPDADLEFAGQQGGPFYPKGATWTVWNTQAGPLEWEIAGGESWLSVTPSGGSLLPLDSVSAAGETTDAAESLAHGTHTANLAFQNTTTGDGDTQRTVRLSVLERHLAYVDAREEGVHGQTTSVVVSPDGAHVFVASEDTLSVFVRDVVTGELALLEEHEDGVGGVDGLRGASSIALSPDGENVYVTAKYDNAIAVFDRNRVTGALTFLEVHEDGSGGVDGLWSASEVAVSPDGAHVYVASWRDDAVVVFARDASTGRLTFLEVQKDGVGGVVGLEFAYSLALSPDGSHVYVATYGLELGNDFLAVFARDTSTGTLTFLEVHQDGVDGVDGLRDRSRVALSPDGAHVYVTSRLDRSVALFARDASAGTLTFQRVYENLVDGEGLDGAVGLALSADGGYLYVASYSDSALSVFRRDAATGELLFVESHSDGVDGVDGLLRAQAVDVSPDGAHVYVVSYMDTKIARFSRVYDERSLIVVKKQTIPEGDPAVFTFTGDVAGVIGDGEFLLLNPTPGTYTSTEVVPSGWSLFKCKCDDTDSTGDMGTATATVELSAGEAVTCVFTNCADSVASTLDLSGVTVSSTEMYEACDTLTADTFTIESTGNVSFRAGNLIVLEDGFSVASGGEFTAEIVGEP